LTPASIIPVFGSQRPYADLNFAGGSFGVGGQIVSDITRLPGFTFTRASTAMFYGSNGLLQTAASGVARFAYDPVTLASQGILVEEARTNLCLQSQDLATTWATSRTSVTVNTTTSPDGTSNADKLVEDVTLGGHQLVQAITTTAVATTISVYAKPAGRDWIALGLNDSGGVARAVYFNVSTGAVGTVGTGFAASIQAVGNGWYRCVATLSAALAGANNLRLYVTTADNVTSYTGDGTSGAFFWQAQVEAGTGASSPIPTTTAAVTRAADVARLTGLPLAYPLSLAARFIKNFGAATSRALTLYIDGNNFATLGLTTALATRLEVAQGGSFQAQLTGATPGLGAATLEAGRFATNDVGFAAQGALVGTDVSATMPSAPTAINIGMFSDGGTEPLNGTISRIRIYNRALPDAQLQSLTT
jgi:hypothetical protein